MQHLISQFWRWVKRDFSAPSPAFIKTRFLISEGLPHATWVETGTFLGDTTAKLAKRSSHVYTIEPSEKLFLDAERRFRKTSNVTVVFGTSEVVLPNVLKSLRGSVNFWLDGHYSAGETYKGESETPILSELAAISSALPKLDSVCVLVDDVRCFANFFGEYKDFPPVQSLIDWAVKHELIWKIEHDIFIAKSKP